MKCYEQEVKYLYAEFSTTSAMTCRQWDKSIPSVKITEKIFKEATGLDPEHDDLERSNCKKAGQNGHLSCGWCLLHERPESMCGCRLKAAINQGE